MHIIVKKTPSNRRFHRHFNHAIGEMVHTRADYLRALKEHDLVPYKKPSHRDPKYKASAWAHEMVEEIRKTKGNPGGRFYDELAKKGYGPRKLMQMKRKTQEADEIGLTRLNNMEGGFLNDSTSHNK